MAVRGCLMSASSLYAGRSLGPRNRPCMGDTCSPVRGPGLRSSFICWPGSCLVQTKLGTLSRCHELADSSVARDGRRQGAKGMGVAQKKERPHNEKTRTEVGRETRSGCPTGKKTVPPQLTERAETGHTGRITVGAGGESSHEQSTM